VERELDVYEPVFARWTSRISRAVSSRARSAYVRHLAQDDLLERASRTGAALPRSWYPQVSQRLPQSSATLAPR